MVQSSFHCAPQHAFDCSWRNFRCLVVHCGNFCHSSQMCNYHSRDAHIIIPVLVMCKCMSVCMYAALETLLTDYVLLSLTSREQRATKIHTPPHLPTVHTLVICNTCFSNHVTILDIHNSHKDGTKTSNTMFTHHLLRVFSNVAWKQAAICVS